MRIARAAALLVVITACGGSAEEPTTSTSTTTTTTTTTLIPSTSTSTTMTSTTTTMRASTTTTAAGPTGSWADEPLIVAPWGAVGWWDGSGWVGSFGSLPVSGGEDYQVVSITGSGTVSGGPETELCEPLQLLGVELDDPDLLGVWPGPFGVAVSAPWFVQPHLVQSLTDDGTYAGHARDVLAGRGMTVPSPAITQVFRVDLEGDGVNEVLVVAEDIDEPGFQASPGDYSVAFVRKVVDGEVQTAILGVSVHPAPSEGDIPYSYAIGGVGDLNGDGKMEIVISGKYYEGAWVEVWEWVNDDLGPVIQLSQGCGA